MSETTNVRREIEYIGVDNVRWSVTLGFDDILTVECKDETREYQLDPIVHIEHNKEYLFLYMEDKSFYQFKFEENLFFVGDIFDKDSEHIDTFASYVFDE